MKSTAPHRNRRDARLSIGVVALLTFVLALASAASVSAGRRPEQAAPRQDRTTGSHHSLPAAAYWWPVKPFRRQHPVRGFFGDPRIDWAVPHVRLARAFHFGVDVSAPDGTPVYGTINGTATVSGERITVQGSRAIEFHYEHVVPAISSGRQVVAYTTLIGRIADGWAHVHFAESRNGVFVNPLRPGGLGPFVDRTRPTIEKVRVRRGLKRYSLRRVTGRVDLVADAADETPLAVARPWNDKPVTPALLRWRLVGRGGVVIPWRTVADFRLHIPPSGDYGRIYAVGTRQNHSYARGQYSFLLRAGWNTAEVGDGVYELQISVADVQGNHAASSRQLVIANHV